ncbi:hypothetical protein WN55_09762, partial [Dufourea novaeangliae]
DSRHDQRRRDALIPRRKGLLGIRVASFVGIGRVVIESTRPATVQRNTPPAFISRGDTPPSTTRPRKPRQE